MNTEHARPGALCADSLPFSAGGSLSQAQALRAAGIEAMYGYLGVITAERVGFILQAGMAFMPCTLADRFDGAEAVAQLHALNMPSSVTTCLDVEGVSTLSDPSGLAAKINAWADAILGSGGNPALYVGTPQPFTSDELWLLRVQGYWRGQGRIVDRSQHLAEPSGCGWWAYQAYPSVQRGGVLVDLDMISQDYRGRSPLWVVP